MVVMALLLSRCLPTPSGSQESASQRSPQTVAWPLSIELHFIASMTATACFGKLEVAFDVMDGVGNESEATTMPHPDRIQTLSGARHGALRRALEP
jgi:hypothetical protein